MDHQGLTGLLSSNNHNQRLTRWYLFLRDLTSLLVQARDTHVHADGLSRQYWPQKLGPWVDEESSSLEVGNVAKPQTAESCRTAPPTYRSADVNCKHLSHYELHMLLIILYFGFCHKLLRITATRLCLS